MRRRGSIKLLFSFAATIILTVFLGVVFLSPFALRGVGDLHDVDWIQLSYVGQTYGAISALLAAIALTGVVISIVLQIRDTRHSRWAQTRTRHYELMRMALDEPLYMNAFSWPDITDDAKQLGAYINLLLALWEMQWEFGDIRESQLRQHLAGTLSTPAGREYWVAAGVARMKYDTNTRRQRQFNRIAEEVYLATSGATSKPVRTPTAAGRSDRDPLFLTLAGAATAWAVVRRLRNHGPSRLGPH
jgi:hypothetical protein